MYTGTELTWDCFPWATTSQVSRSGQTQRAWLVTLQDCQSRWSPPQNFPFPVTAAALLMGSQNPQATTTDPAISQAVEPSRQTVLTRISLNQSGTRMLARSTPGKTTRSRRERRSTLWAMDLLGMMPTTLLELTPELVQVRDSTVFHSQLQFITFNAVNCHILGHKSEPDVIGINGKF